MIMKKLAKSLNLTIASTLLVIAGSSMSLANAQPIERESKLVKVCEAVQNDNKSKLSRAVKNAGYSYSAIANGLVCNGQPVLEFAVANGSNEVAEKLARRTNKALPDLVANVE
jgi:hypothetical protein